jgi:hypothetical protein
MSSGSGWGELLGGRTRACTCLLCYVPQVLAPCRRAVKSGNDVKVGMACKWESRGDLLYLNYSWRLG